MSAAADPFLHQLIDSLHDCPMQSKVRRLMPLPVGVVFIEWQGMTEQDVRGHFRTIRQMGFNCLKQIMALPTEAGGLGHARILHLALDEGLIPWWYGTGGYEAVTDALLDRLGIDKTLDIDAILAHPKMVEHQTALLRRRIDREQEQRELEEKTQSVQPAGRAERARVPGMLEAMAGYNLEEHEVPAFIEWLKTQYQNLDELRRAWNVYHLGLRPALAWNNWDDLAEDLADWPQREYRFLRDVLRFRADTYLEHRIRRQMRERDAFDVHMPIRCGGEMSLFLPFSSRGIDMEQVAIEMAQGGSFYPSTHPTWHFEEVDFEYVRPLYMYDALAADWAKGIWSATWESTGGPQYFSGGKAPFVEAVREKFPGFAIDAGAIAQFMLTHLAAGYKGFGIWCWNPRMAGWEAGEFALTDRNGKPTPRAAMAGAIGRAAVTYRREIWAAHKEPMVGVLHDWENEATWAAMSATGRTMYKSVPIQARVGVCRALIDANIPWEHVTPRQLRAGLGPRYRTIYLSAFIRLSTELLADLEAYVRQGGRVVLDMPSAYYDEFGRLLRTDAGSAFEKLFGVEFHEYWFANNVKYQLDGHNLEGFTASLTATSAKVLKRYGIGQELKDPAVTENHLGRGTAVVLGCQASLSCLRPGNAAMQRLIVEQCLHGAQPPYACQEALVYRIAAPQADHYFLVNDGPAVVARLETGAYEYRGATDAVTGQKLETAGRVCTVKLEAHSARWVRMAR